MLAREDVRRLALALPEAVEAPHFELTSFRLGKKIFATMGAERPLMVTLDPEDQRNLVESDPERIYPVPGGWGRKGSTFVRFETMTADEVAGLLRLAWARIAPKRLLSAHSAGPA